MKLEPIIDKALLKEDTFSVSKQDFNGKVNVKFNKIEKINFKQGVLIFSGLIIGLIALSKKIDQKVADRRIKF